MRRMIVVLALAALAVVSTAGLSAQGTDPGTASSSALVTEAAKLNRSMEEIRSLLMQLLERQQVDVLLKRIEIKSRSLEAMENELRSARSQRDGYQEEGQMLRGQVERVEALMEEEEDRLGVLQSDSQWRAEKEQVELRLKVLGDQLQALELRILEMESDLASRRDELREWEEYVDRQLGLD